MQTGLLLWGFLGLAFAQAAFWRPLTGWLPARWSEGPVSYTHLDVYKRQMQG